MNLLKSELKKNYDSFSKQLIRSFVFSFKKLTTSDALFLESYNSLASLEGWKAFVLETSVQKDALAFFIEAQNDALLSHSFARIGSWRSSLQALRSSIENILYCLYYKDHPVEYLLWSEGKHQLPISEYLTYLEKHPAVVLLGLKSSGLEILKKEYSTLSRSVHGSSRAFQMTVAPDSFPALMIPSVDKLSQWKTRERFVLQAINMILVTLFSNYLEGAKASNLRKSISLVLSPKQKSFFSTFFKIRFP